MNLLNRIKAAVFAFKYPDSKLVSLEGSVSHSEHGITYLSVTNPHGFRQGDKFQLSGMKDMFMVTAVSLEIIKL